MKKNLAKLKISEEKFKHIFIWQKIFIIKPIAFIFLLAILWLWLSFYWRDGYPMKGLVINALILLLGVFWSIYFMVKRNVIEINSNDLLARTTPISLKNEVRIPIIEIESVGFNNKLGGIYDIVVKKRNGEIVKIVNKAGTWAEAGGLKVELNKSLQHFQMLYSLSDEDTSVIS